MFQPSYNTNAHISNLKISHGLNYISFEQLHTFNNQTNLFVLREEI